MAHFRLTLVSCCLTLVALGASSLACSDASNPNSRSRGNALEEGDKVECKANVVGDPGGSTCFEDEDLKKKAALTCEAAGLTLVDIGYASDCAGGSTYAKFACCGGEPPQPPEPTCFGDVVGDPGGTCNADEDSQAQGLGRLYGQGRRDHRDRLRQRLRRRLDLRQVRVLRRQAGAAAVRVHLRRRGLAGSGLQRQRPPQGEGGGQLVRSEGSR